MTYSGRIQNGVIVLDDKGIQLPEGGEVRVEIVVPSEPKSHSLVDQFEGLIGQAKNLPTDFAANHDHYLHGAPRKE